jgi:hypothetical protein
MYIELIYIAQPQNNMLNALKLKYIISFNLSWIRKINPPLIDH